MQNAISLLNLNQQIKDVIDSSLEANYWVIAEIGELRSGPNGHAYLELLEKKGNQTLAKIRANIWSYSYRTIATNFKNATGQNLQASMKIMALVTVTFHELYGISLTIKDIDPAFTLGDRAKIRQETIDRLFKEGLLDKNKQLNLPTVPQYVGVISSPNAAGFGDFINQLKNNPYGYNIETQLFPAIMQGNGAPHSILDALKKAILTPAIQVIVIIRGGGATLDLECFDHYELAKGIAESPLPVITGIGHERDETIADMVAHSKLKTPTAVAEFLIAGFLAFEESIHLLHKRMERTVKLQLQTEHKGLDAFEMRLVYLSTNEIKTIKETLQTFHYKIKSKSEQELRLFKLALNTNADKLNKSWTRALDSQSRQLQILEKDILRLNPEEHFKRGYTRSEINGLPLQTNTPSIGDQMITYTSNKKIESIIQKTDNYEK